MGKSNFQESNPQQKNRSLGQISSEPLTWVSEGRVSVNADTQIIAAAVGTGRIVVLALAPSEDTGVHLEFDGTAATTSQPIGIFPGERVAFSTEQEIRGIKAGAAAVTVEVFSAKVV